MMIQDDTCSQSKMWRYLHSRVTTNIKSFDGIEIDHIVYCM